MKALMSFLLFLPAIAWAQLDLEPGETVPVSCQSQLLPYCNANPSATFTVSCNDCPTCPPTQCPPVPPTEGDCRNEGPDRECLRWVSEPEAPPPPPPTGTPFSSCRSFSGGEWVLTQDIGGVQSGCLTGWATSIDLAGHEVRCTGARDTPCVNVGGTIKNGSIVMEEYEGNNFGGPAVYSDSGTDVTLDNVDVHCENMKKNVDFGCVQNQYSGRFTLTNSDITTGQGQCLHGTGEGGFEYVGSGSTCAGDPIFFYNGVSNVTDSPQGYWSITNSSNVTLDGWANSNGGLIANSTQVVISNGNSNGFGIISIVGGDDILLEGNNILGGGAQYWSAAIQCRSNATGVVLRDNIVSSRGFAYYGYAPGSGCPGVIIDGGTYTAGNNDAIMCRRCPLIALSNLTLNGRLRTHAQLGNITASNVTINPSAGLHLDLRSQESFGPGPTVLTVSGGNIPWSCTGARCGAVVYN